MTVEKRAWVRFRERVAGMGAASEDWDKDLSQLSWMAAGYVFFSL
jgi:hypothetical protein